MLEYYSITIMVVPVLFWDICLQRTFFRKDHKIIGTSISLLDFAVVRGWRMYWRLGIRWQLAWPWSDMPVIGRMLFSGSKGGRFRPEFYTMLFTMHATVMIFFVIIPILAGCLREFSDPVDDRRRRHGLSDT